MKTNDTFELDVPEETRGAELIEKVAASIKEDVSAIKLISGGRILSGTATLAESKISDGAVLNVMVKKTQVVATTNEAEAKPQPIVQAPAPSAAIHAAAQLPPSVKKTEEEGDWFLPQQKKQAPVPQQEVKPSQQDEMPRSYLESIGAVKKAPNQPLAKELAMQPKVQRPAPEAAPAAKPAQQPGPQKQAISIQQFAQMLADMTDEDFANSLQEPHNRQAILQMIGPENAFLLSKPDLLRATLLNEIFGSLGAQQKDEPEAGESTGEQDEPEPQAPQQAAAPRQPGAPAPQVQTALEQLRHKWANELAIIKGMGLQADDATILQLLEVYGGNLDSVINALFDTQ